MGSRRRSRREVSETKTTFGSGLVLEGEKKSEKAGSGSGLMLMYMVSYTSLRFANSSGR